MNLSLESSLNKRYEHAEACKVYREMEYIAEYALELLDGKVDLEAESEISTTITIGEHERHKALHWWLLRMRAIAMAGEDSGLSIFERAFGAEWVLWNQLEKSLFLREEPLLISNAYCAVDFELINCLGNVTELEVFPYVAPAAYLRLKHLISLKRYGDILELIPSFLAYLSIVYKSWQLSDQIKKLLCGIYSETLLMRCRLIFASGLPKSEFESDLRLAIKLSPELSLPILFLLIRVGHFTFTQEAELTQNSSSYFQNAWINKGPYTVFDQNSYSSDNTDLFKIINSITSLNLSKNKKTLEDALEKWRLRLISNVYDETFRFIPMGLAYLIATLLEEGNLIRAFTLIDHMLLEFPESPWTKIYNIRRDLHRSIVESSNNLNSLTELLDQTGLVLIIPNQLESQGDLAMHLGRADIALNCYITAFKALMFNNENYYVFIDHTMATTPLGLFKILPDQNMIEDAKKLILSAKLLDASEIIDRSIVEREVALDFIEKTNLAQIKELLTTAGINNIFLNGVPWQEQGNSTIKLSNTLNMFLDRIIKRLT